MLLATFAGFFIFSGNLARIPAVAEFFTGILTGAELWVAAGLSQIISNVPTCFVLAEFTDHARDMILGTDIGGLGTPIASMCSLIGIKLYLNAKGEKGRHFWLKFLGLNFLLLFVLLPITALIG